MMRPTRSCCEKAKKGKTVEPGWMGVNKVRSTRLMGDDTGVMAVRTVEIIASRRRVDPRLVIQAGSSTLNTIYRKEELLTPEFDDDGMDWECCSDDNPWFKSDTAADPSQSQGTPTSSLS